MLDIEMAHIKGKKLIENDIKLFEEILQTQIETEIANVILPDDFKEFYLKHNGGMPSKSYIDSNHEACQFYFIGYSSEKGSLLYIREITPINLVPKWGLIFANDPFGNNFVLDLRIGNNYGNIWFFDNDKVEPPTVLAKTFKDFINSLKSVEELEDD